MRTLRLATVALALAVGLPRAAGAYSIEIDSETLGQGYQLVGGNGGLISRRRLDQYLGLSIWNLGPKDGSGAPLPRNQFYFTSLMRLEFDLGDFFPGNDRIGGRNVSAELSNNRYELLYAYAGARELFGLLDLKLGRQIQFDGYEFTSFDGLSLEVKTPWYLAAQVYGGLLVNGFLPIDSPIFRPDGTAPGALTPHDADPKPVLAVALRSFGFRDLDARFTYRRVFSPGTGRFLSPCPPAPDLRTAERCTGATDGTTEEKLSWSARGRLLDGTIVPWLGLRYDLLVGVLDTILAGARVNLGEHHGVQAEYFYSYPTYDGDSIWNVFVRSRFDDVRASYDVRFGRLRAYARGFLRFFHDVDEAKDRQSSLNRHPTPGGENLDGGGDLGARFDVRRGFVRADTYFELGYGGKEIGADLVSRMNVWRDIASVEGRLTYVHFEDDVHLGPTEIVNGQVVSRLRADSFGFQVGGRIAFGRGILLHLLLEDNINRFYTSQLRLFAVLDVSLLLGSGGFAQAQPRGIGPGLGGFGTGYGMGTGY